MDAGPHHRRRDAGLFIHRHPHDDAPREATGATRDMTASAATIDVAYRGMLATFALDVAFTAPMRGITALFGPSGSGKTTVLRCMAGLNRLPGRLVVGGDVWEDADAGKFCAPHQRPVGYVFQEASLFPHLSVRQN